VEITKDSKEETDPEEKKKIQPSSKDPLDTKTNNKVVIKINPNSPSKTILLNLLCPQMFILTTPILHSFHTTLQIHSYLLHILYRL